jgi:GT2 family glycosyltransferase
MNVPTHGSPLLALSARLSWAAPSELRQGRGVRTSVVIVAYQSGPALMRCLHSIEPEINGDLEVLVVDNGDGGPEIAEAQRMSFVRLLSPGENLGFAGGCNLGARHATGTALLFLNPDTVVAPGAIGALVDRLDDPAVGITTARLRLLDRPELLNSAGNVLHVTGLAWAGRYGEPAEQVTQEEEVAYPTGAAMAIRTRVFWDLGGFTEELFMYQEDLELAWRARLRGLRIVLVPKADVYHDYEYGRNPTKHYLLERNRLVFLLSAYSRRLLILLGPVLVSTELAMVALALKDGWARDKFAGWRWCVRRARWLRQRRRKTQALRLVPDRELASHLTSIVDPAMIDVPALVRLMNPLLERYWSVVRRAL